MKTIQITMTEALLAALDADGEVKERGRSAVLRQATAEYLARHRRDAIARQYQAAYGAGENVAEDLAGWSEEGVWPSE